MAFWNKKRSAPKESKVVSDYYKLHTDAVRDLAEADESNSPEVSEEELAKYRSGPKIRLSDGAKAILLKMWFAGAVCFFIFWGTSNYVTARLDLLFIFGMALGMVTDLLTNNALRFLSKTEGSNDRWMMFPKAKYINFFLNIIYAMLLLGCVDIFYNLINMLLLATTGHASLGVEPILFGCVYTGFDLLFISMKLMMKKIVDDAKESVQSGGIRES